jgi:hypothetical protein
MEETIGLAARTFDGARDVNVFEIIRRLADQSIMALHRCAVRP